MPDERRFSLRISEEMNNRLSRHFYQWGDKSQFFISCIGQILDLLDEYGLFLIYAIRDGKARLTVKFDATYMEKLQEKIENEESTGHAQTKT